MELMLAGPRQGKVGKRIRAGRAAAWKDRKRIRAGRAAAGEGQKKEFALAGPGGGKGKK